MKDLVAKGYSPIKSIRDSTGKVFSYVMKDPRGNYFYLVARSTELYRNKYFGTQIWLVKLAEAKDYPLVLAIVLLGALREYHVFDGKTLLDKMDGANWRSGEQFGNFFSGNGEAWDAETPLYAAYRRIQGKGGQAEL